MNKYIASALGICTLAIVLLVSCNKINQATDMGQDLIPPVDNIHTFDTTLEVETYNNIFTAAQDSFRSIRSDIQYVGNITNDPIFGKTDARIFFQLYSTEAFKNAPGKRYIDSVVLVLNYVETYGDTAMAQTMEVSEIAPGVPFNAITYDTVISGVTPQAIPKRSSGYDFSTTFPTSGVLGSKTVVPYTLKDSIVLIRVDTTKTVRQMRIKLDNAFGQRLLSYDSATIANDTLFKEKFNGFAVKSVGGGNAVLGFNLAGSALAVYYRYDNPTTAGDLDTTNTNFTLSINSASANYVVRDRSGTQVVATANDNVADQLVYVQNTPGTYSTIKIPGLANLKNSLIHLAELQMETVYHPQDTLFNTVPLFLDMFDNTSGKYKTIPYSIDNINLSSDGTATNANISSAGYISFGSVGSFKKDPSNNTVRQWRFNLTRFAQYLVKGTLTTGDFRLYTSPHLTVENGNYPNSVFSRVNIQSAVDPVRGRARIGGGNHPTQKMKLRIVYSKI